MPIGLQQPQQMPPMRPLGQPAQSPYTAFLAAMNRERAMFPTYSGSKPPYIVGGSGAPSGGGSKDDPDYNDTKGDADTGEGEGGGSSMDDPDPEYAAKGGSIGEPEHAVWKPEPGFPQVPPIDDYEEDNRPHEPPPKEQNLAAGGSVKAYDSGGAIEEEDPGNAEADATPDEQTDERRRAAEERVAQDNDKGDTGSSNNPPSAPQGGIPDDTKAAVPTGSTGEPEPATGEHADPDRADWVQNSAAALQSGYGWLKKQFGLDDAVPSPDYAKGVANYHSGTGAATHEDAEAVEAAADPEHKLSDQERTTKALSDVHDFYGDQSGEKVGSLMQRLRHLYTTYAAHAAAAFEHGDTATGVKSFNEANSNIPGPYSIHLRAPPTPGDTPAIPGRPGSAAFESIKARRNPPTAIPLEGEEAEPRDTSQGALRRLGQSTMQPGGVLANAPPIGDIARDFGNKVMRPGGLLGPSGNTGQQERGSPLEGEDRGQPVDRASTPAIPEQPSRFAHAVGTAARYLGSRRDDSGNITESANKPPPTSAPLEAVITNNATGETKVVPTTPEAVIQTAREHFDNRVMKPGQMVPVTVNGRTTMVPHEGPGGQAGLQGPPHRQTEREYWQGRSDDLENFRRQRVGDPTRVGAAARAPNYPFAHQASDERPLQNPRWASENTPGARAVRDSQQNKVDVANARRGDVGKTAQMQIDANKERDAVKYGRDDTKAALAAKQHDEDKQQTYDLDVAKEVGRARRAADPFGNNPAAADKAAADTLKNFPKWSGNQGRQQQTGPVHINTAEERAKLAPGTEYVGPDGVARSVPYPNGKK